MFFHSPESMHRAADGAIAGGRNVLTGGGIGWVEGGGWERRAIRWSAENGRRMPGRGSWRIPAARRGVSVSD